MASDSPIPEKNADAALWAQPTAWLSSTEDWLNRPALANICIQTAEASAKNRMQIISSIKNRLDLFFSMIGFLAVQ